jgi:hypothetical protein
MMNRRTAIHRAAIYIGASIISTDLILMSGCKPSPDSQSSVVINAIDFTKYKPLLKAIGQTILPAYNKHPGFVGIKGEEVLILLLNDCYKKEDQEKVVKGLTDFENEIKSKHAKSFEQLDPTNQIQIITDLDTKYFDKNIDKEQKPTFYGTIKEAVLISYFTDAAVMKKVFTHVKIPRKYDGAFRVNPKEYHSVYGFGA